MLSQTWVDTLDQFNNFFLTQFPSCSFVKRHFDKKQLKVTTTTKNLLSYKKGPYIHDIHTEGGWGSLEICHVFADSIVLKQQIYCSFLQMVGVGGSKIWSFFVDVING